MDRFRSRAGSDGILDQSDIASATARQEADVRARVVGRILENDLNWDGVVTEQELRDSLALREKPRRFNVEMAISNYLEADTDHDGTISSQEATAFATSFPIIYRENDRRQIEGAERLLSYDPNGDERLTASELTAAVIAGFSAYDKDGDGRLTPDETAPLKDKEWARRDNQVGPGSPDCQLPKPSENAKIVFIRGTRASTLSDVSLFGQNRLTEAQELVVKEGDAPVYLVVSTKMPVIWQIGGDKSRVERFVTIDSLKGSGRYAATGVTGLAKELVNFIAGHCFGQMRDDGPDKRERIANTLTQLLGRAPNEILLTENLSDDDLLPHTDEAGEQISPSDMVSFATGKPPAFESFGSMVDREIYDAFVQLRPGGVANIDPVNIVTPAKVEKYQVLPEAAGLIQLMQQGLIVRGPMTDGTRILPVDANQGNTRSYLIVKPIPRFPPELKYPPLVVFVLGKGVRMPIGHPGFSPIISEETGALLLDPSDIPTTGVDVFADINPRPIW
ncbi:MAG: hypothetical protein QM744_16335 [Mesorhizobium sp.]